MSGKRRALIIGLDTPEHQYVREMLRRKNISLVNADNDLPSTDELDWAQIIICELHGRKSETKLVELLKVQYEKIPVIFLLNKDAQNYNEIKSTKLHRKLAVNCSRKILSTHITDLLLLAETEAHVRKLQNEIAEYDELEKLVDFTDFELFISNTLQFFATHFLAENVFWLEQGDFEYFTHELYKTRQRNVMTGQEGDNRILRALKKSLHEDLSSYVKMFSLSKTSEHITAPLEAHSKNTHLVLIPIFDMASDFPTAHCLLIQPRAWSARTAEFLQSKMMKRISTFYHLAKTHNHTKQMNYIDDVTGLYNQRYMFLTLEKEIKRATRNSDPFSVLFIDIDHFKKVNDVNGHLVGSKILNELGKIFKSNIRSTDYGFRYGGDEYLLLLAGANSGVAKMVAERIRSQVEASEFVVDGAHVRVTVSIGIATFPEHGLTKEEVLRMADEAMYYGKSKSRNVVYVANEVL